MKNVDLSRATLGRIPSYLKYLRELPAERKNISATVIAKDLGLGEVQVRKDLGALCGSGKPRVGYVVEQLTSSLEKCVSGDFGGAVIVGAGKLGRALLDYGGFSDYGLDILAAFDKKNTESESSPSGRPILPVERFAEFCRQNTVSIGIIAVTADAAQEVFDLMYECGIRAMLCFAPCKLVIPGDAVIRYENMALSLAHLKMQIKNNN